jgi:membrane dipeptidase
MPAVLAALFLLPAVPAGLAAEDQQPAQPTAGHFALAHEVFREVPLIDGHNDMPWQLHKLGNDLTAVDLRQGTDQLPIPWATDIPRLRAGGVGAQFWAAYVPTRLGAAEAVQATFEQIDLIHRLVRHDPDTFELALTADDIERSHRAGRIASLIGVEGGHSIGDSLGVLRMMHQLGARYLTLTHIKNTSWADAAGDTPQHGGLTAFGEEVVRELNRLGVMVDLSHVTDDTMRDALRVTRAPVIFSHSGARAICDHDRNVPDDVLRETAKNRGMVMVCFLPGYVTNPARDAFLAGTAERRRLAGVHPNDPDKVEFEMNAWREANPPTSVPTVRDVADHVDHLRRVMGVDHIGIGSDFDGFSGAVSGLEDVSTFPALFAELARRGYGKEDLKKIAGLNLLRVMRDVEAVAGRWPPEQPQLMRP